MKLIIIGYGSIAQSLIPILIKELEREIHCIRIISPDTTLLDYNFTTPITLENTALTRSNYKIILSDLDRNCFVINLSVNVSSLALVTLCQLKGARYLDTCIEPWAGGYFNTTSDLSQRTNYRLRHELLSLKPKYLNGPTSVIAHGANPGMVSHFVKQALINLSRDLYGEVPSLSQQSEWAELAQRLNIKVIHIAEHDTQTPINRKVPDEFVNTWSVDGLISEGCQPAEIGWGTHEECLPPSGKKHSIGSGCSIYLERPGASVRIKTWTPAKGPCLGYLITHNESISIADYLTLCRDGKVSYRPTVNYAYRPCDDTVLSINELSGRSWTAPRSKRVLRGQDIVSGSDYLGVLLMGHEKNAYWYGSIVANEESQKIHTALSATSLQVVAGIISGIRWAIANPKAGIVEAEEIDFSFAIAAAKPYLGRMQGVYTSWTPSEPQGLFPTKESRAWQLIEFME